MVKSTSSCFKIITCSSDYVEEDDFERTESKSSTDRRQWSFRKRSARHRVLNNTMISETPSTGNKESPESVSIDFHAQNNPIIPEKVSVSQWTDEMIPLSTAENLRVPDPLIATENASKIGTFVSTEDISKIDSSTTMENASKIDPSLEEYVATVIQTAIRRYLAHRDLLKLKNVVKLQAAVRGHLVRSQAVGTLRCVQAIVKVQALVRARHVKMTLGCPVFEAKLGTKNEKNNQSVKPLGKENQGTGSSTEKFLSNGFARQLLESTPKKKPIHIKCDLSRPDSAWTWLERWMSVSSSDFAWPQKPQFDPENEEQVERTDISVSALRTEIPAEIIPESADLKSYIRETTTPLEAEENLITYDADNFDFQFYHPTSSSMIDDMQQPHLENASLSKAREISSNMNVNQAEMQMDASSQTVLDSIPNKPPEADSEQPNHFMEKFAYERPETEGKKDNEQSIHSMKKVAYEQPETEGKKFVFAPRKSSNPAFVAVQSKFEELSLAVTSGRPISSHQDIGAESKFDSLSYLGDSLTQTNELSLTENLITLDPRIHVGGSECGTELSISSTLDSPDRSEVGGGELENECIVVENEITVRNGTADDASKIGNLYVEAKNHSSTSHLNSPYSASVQPEKLEYVDGDAVDSPCGGQYQEGSASDVQIRLDTATDGQAQTLSPEGSPRSHITAPESHGTPSSQVSVKDKKNKLNKNGPTQNRKSQSAGKGSSINRNHNSVVRNSMEQLPKDPKNGKRRNSFGPARPDHVDQEPRDSCSDSIPSYMQATESAKAKALVNISPRSSPDLQDKETYVKKRHSLPGTNGKQGSPRIQPSISQVQQGVKGKSTYSPREKWQR